MGCIPLYSNRSTNGAMERFLKIIVRFIIKSNVHGAVSIIKILACFINIVENTQNMSHGSEESYNAILAVQK